MNTSRVVSCALVALLLGGCATPGLPVESKPCAAPAGLELTWSAERRGALPWYVLAGEGVSEVSLEGTTLSWSGTSRWSVTLELLNAEVDELEAGSHGLRVSPVVGFSEGQAYVLPGSSVPVATPVPDEDAEFSYPFVFTRGIPTTVPGSRLRATEHLAPEERRRASVRNQSGNDVLLQADGTIVLVDRELPERWEATTDTPYPGEVVLKPE